MRISIQTASFNIRLSLGQRKRLTYRLVAAKARTFRLTDLDDKRLDRLRRMVDKSPSAVQSLALAHLLATLERDQPIWLTVPSEPDEPVAEPSEDDETGSAGLAGRPEAAVQAAGTSNGHGRGKRSA